MTLNELNEGDLATVVRISENTRMKQRFTDIGLLLGTKVECLLESPRKGS